MTKPHHPPRQSPGSQAEQKQSSAATRAWEHLRRDGKTGMSSWWREHADHHMPILLSTDGPFKGCTPEKGHNPRLDPLPCAPAPAGLFVSA
ncbi:hypothetical protein DDA93_00390 [Arthrobacter sp. Bz4]|nr:hypothetical protein DDA93_00390 [Arthrobacter sp. Bz4]